MGALRDDENSYQGSGIGPKLVMTGRLQGTALGRPVEIAAEGQELLLRVPNLRSAWGLRKTAGSGVAPLLQSLSNFGFRLQLRIGQRLTVEVFPNPSFAVRVIAPTLRFNKRAVSR